MLYITVLFSNIVLLFIISYPSFFIFMSAMQFLYSCTPVDTPIEAKYISNRNPINVLIIIPPFKYWLILYYKSLKKASFPCFNYYFNSFSSSGISSVISLLAATKKYIKYAKTSGNPIGIIINTPINNVSISDSRLKFENSEIKN